MTTIPIFVAAALAGYLLGAIPVGLLVGRLIRGVDIRSSGSGRTGTTNALRTLGPRGAALVLFLDVAKGLLAVLVGRAILGAVEPPLADWGGASSAVAAVFGHTRSIFIGFGGGRGAATAGGGLIAFAPLAVPPLLLLWIVVIWRTRYVSLGTLLIALSAPLIVALLVAFELAVPAALAFIAMSAVVVILAHADNIERLRAGTERKFGTSEAPR